MWELRHAVNYDADQRLSTASAQADFDDVDWSIVSRQNSDVFEVEQFVQCRWYDSGTFPEFKFRTLRRIQAHCGRELPLNLLLGALSLYKIRPHMHIRNPRSVQSAYQKSVYMLSRFEVQKVKKESQQKQKTNSTLKTLKL